MQNKNSLGKIKKEIGEKTLGYLMTAFGLVAGLAWNEAVKSLINSIYPGETNGLLAKFIYAIIITLFVVLIGIYLTIFFRKDKKLDDK